MQNRNVKGTGTVHSYRKGMTVVIVAIMVAHTDFWRVRTAIVHHYNGRKTAKRAARPISAAIVIFAIKRLAKEDKYPKDINFLAKINQSR